jgi:hypothetical protein
MNATNSQLSAGLVFRTRPRCHLQTRLTLRRPSQSLHVLLVPSHRLSGTTLPSSPMESPRALRTLVDLALGPAIRGGSKAIHTHRSGVQQTKPAKDRRLGEGDRWARGGGIASNDMRQATRRQVSIYTLCIYDLYMQAEESTTATKKEKEKSKMLLVLSSCVLHTTPALPRRIQR